MLKSIFEFKENFTRASLTFNFYYFSENYAWNKNSVILKLKQNEYLTFLTQRYRV